LKRSERIAVITKHLVEHPGHLFSLSYFADLLGAAKSTISEDLTLIKETWRRQGWGELKTVPGAAGGVKYLPRIAGEERKAFLQALAARLQDPERILPGGFLYISDLIGDPAVTGPLGKIFATLLAAETDYVVTVATKGIPLAMATAQALHRPAVIIRDDSKVTEGSSVSLNYLSGSRTIRTMSLSRRALPRGARVLFIDDFMKAGSTAQAVVKLMEEFGARVVGAGFLIATAWPKEKLIRDYVALLSLEEVDEHRGRVVVRPHAAL